MVMQFDLHLFVEGHPKSIGFQVLAFDPTNPGHWSNGS